jgi:gamma-glutamylputrescine oxidase
MALTPDLLSNSLYAATANNWVEQPMLSGDTTCDVVVVGGGFTGISAALAAAEKGFSVILLESRTIGFGASGRNGGQLIPGLRWAMSDIDAEFGRERAKAIFDLAWDGCDAVLNRIKRHGIECDLKFGHLEAAYRPSHLSDFQREIEFLNNEFGWCTADIVTANDMGSHINGGNYHGGIYERRGGHFHPLNYVLGLAKAAEAAGVRIYENSAALEIKNAAKVSVKTAYGHVTALYAINASDAWMHEVSPDIGRFTVPVMNYNIATAPLEYADDLLPSDAAVADSRFVLNYFRLSADKRLIFGGGEKYVQTPPANIAAFVRRHMTEVFPSLKDVPIDYAWGGAVAVTLNRLPHMGRIGNMFYAHGFSGHGALITTLAGELIVEAMAGTAKRFDVFAGLPHRPFPGGRMLARPLATLGLMWFALRDRL